MAKILTPLNLEEKTIFLSSACLHTDGMQWGLWNLQEHISHSKLPRLLNNSTRVATVRQAGKLFGNACLQEKWNRSTESQRFMEWVIWISYGGRGFRLWTMLVKTLSRSSHLVISGSKDFQLPEFCDANWSILAPSGSLKISAHVWVTIDGVWIGDSIYWPLIHTTHNTTASLVYRL
jgi:hypothetical protein